MFTDIFLLECMLFYFVVPITFISFVKYYGLILLKQKKNTFFSSYSVTLKYNSTNFTDYLIIGPQSIKIPILAIRFYFLEV